MTDHTDVKREEFAGSESGKGPALIEKFVIRLPKGLRNKIKHLSEQNRRSMNSEIIMVLEKHIQNNLTDTESLARELANESERHATAQQFSTESELAAGSELAKRLEALPEEKKLALLELLG